MICHKLAQSIHQILLLTLQHSVLSLSHEISHGETFKKLYSLLFGYYRKSLWLNNIFYRVCCHIFTQMFNPNVDILDAWRPFQWHGHCFSWLAAWCINSSKNRTIRKAQWKEYQKHSHRNKEHWLILPAWRFWLDLKLNVHFDRNFL